MTHRRIADLPELLTPGDLVVANDTKVLPARLIAYRVETGRPVDILFVRPVDETVWEVMLKGRFRVGQRFHLAGDVRATILKRDQTGTALRVDSPRPFREVMEEHGRMPLPPYIAREPEPADRSWYQTVFATVDGAIAAPTAGLHLTDRVRARLAAREIGWATVTLHVGPGTFKPVASERIEDHRMEVERWMLPADTEAAVRRTRQNGRRIVAVGTTSVRTLESAVGASAEVRAGEGETDLFITPGYRFRVVDALLTNFHLPRSTLLMLVSAFAGLDLIRTAYRVAVEERYRFYSYGDAMLIL